MTTTAQHPHAAGNITVTRYSRGEVVSVVTMTPAGQRTEAPQSTEGPRIVADRSKAGRPRKIGNASATSDQRRAKAGA